MILTNKGWVAQNKYVPHCEASYCCQQESVGLHKKWSRFYQKKRDVWWKTLKVQIMRPKAAPEICRSPQSFIYRIFLCMHCSYISFSVLFQTKSSLVWKSYTQKLRTIFQTNSSLVWKEKNWFCKTQIPNQIQIGLENFDDHCQCPENSKPNSVWFGKIIDYCQRLEPWTNSSFIL